MGLVRTDRISLAQDDEGVWYLFKDDAGFEFEEAKTGALFLIHPELAAEYLKSYGLEPVEGFKSFLAEEATTVRKTDYWGMYLSQDEGTEE